MKNVFKIIAIFFLLLEIKADAQFNLYNSIRYNNTPANLSPYLKTINLSSQSALVSPYVANNPGPTDNLPNFPAVDSLARSLSGQTVPLTFDIEVWPYWTTASGNLNQTIKWLKQVVDSFKQMNSLTPVGYYGVVPEQAYQWRSIDPVNNPSGYSSWKNINASMASVASLIDIFFPSFYAYDTDTSSWRKMVDSTVSVAKRYGTGKPIYAYIWPQYHDGSAYNLQYIDTARWRFQLQTLYSRINGCVLWTSNTDQYGNKISWDPNMPWWQVTKSFMVINNLTAPFVLDNFLITGASNNVQMQWATSTDTTTHYFIVQKSTDGINFTNLSGQIISQSSGKQSAYYYTENTYSYTDPAAATSKVYYRLAVMSNIGTTTYSSVISYSPAASVFTPGNIAVLRIGGNNSSGTYLGSPASAGSSVHIDAYNTSGVFQKTIDINTNASDSFYLSSTASEGLLSLSTNGQYLTAFGYNAKNANTIYKNTAAVSPRTVPMIKFDGTINTSTALTDYFTGTTPTAATTGSAITTNGKDIWLAGNQSNGISYTTIGSTGGEICVASTYSSNKSVAVFQNDLYFVSGSTVGLVAANGGTPKTTGNTMTALNVNGSGISSAAPNQILLLDMNTAIPGADVMYITNAGSANTSGILKYCKDVNGVWQPYGSYGNTNADSIYFGITGSATGTSVSLFITRGIKTGNYPGRIVMLTDNSGYNGIMNGVQGWSVPAPANSTYRGVAFVPVPSFYYNGSGNLEDVTSWGTNTDGTGPNPVNFTSDYQTFYIQQGNPGLGGNWTVTGNNSKVVLGDGANAITLNIPGNASINAVVDVLNNATLNNSNAVNPAFGVLYTGSTIGFTGAVSQTVPAATYSNLIINNAATVTVTGGSIINNQLGIISGNFSIGDGGTNPGILTLGNTVSVTIAPGAVLSIPSNGTFNAANNPITVQSNSTGAGAIGIVAGTFSNPGNVTVQCFIPAQRGYRTMGHPFSNSVPLSSLSSMVDITGPGGNSNGFVNSSFNNPSANYYDNSLDQWMAYTNTSQTWKFGNGLLLFVRGAKGEGLSGPATGSNAYTATTGPSDITLSLSGNINTGPVSYVTNAAATWNFVGNPYPAPIDVNKIGNIGTVAGPANAVYVWQSNLQAPFKAEASGQYVIETLGASPVVIPVYGAFFINNTTGGAATLNFTENAKNTTASPIGLFGGNTDTSISLTALKND